MAESLSGITEAAHLVGATRQGIRRLLLDDPTFPRPIAVLASDRVWNTDDLTSWATGRGVTLDRRPREIAGLMSEANHALLAAHRVARRLRHDHVGVDHLWLALGEADVAGPAVRILMDFGVSLDDVERSAIKRATSDGNEPRASIARKEIPVSARAQTTITRALFYVAELNDDQLDSRHILLALLDEWQRDSVSHYLELIGVTRDDLRERAAVWGEDSNRGG
ncbi:MAG TPA: Clp protease N-terminal domain-containing protein [Candidatus Limnocylindrales bacterium]|jgi:hypothetical protein